MEGRKINPFNALNKVSYSTIIFGGAVLILAAVITRIYEPFLRIELALISLIFLNLFFYSLNRDKISELEKEEERKDEV